MDFQHFCGSQFWDENLTWNTLNNSLPDVTPCAENLALVWAPCVLLWLTLIPYIHSLKVNFRGRSFQPLTKFTLLKSIFPVFLVALNLYDLIAESHVALAGLFSPIITIATLILVGVLVHVYRIYGQFSSGPLWIFWLLSFLTQTIRAYIYFKRYLWDGSEGDRLPAILYTIHTSLYLVGLILSSISDASAQVLREGKDVSPEVTASFPSAMTFQWMQPIMNAGYRKKQEGHGIEREDLHYLSPPDRINNFFPQFEKDWNDSIQRWRQRLVKACEARATGNHIQADSDEPTPLIVQSSEKKKCQGPSLLAVLMKHWLPLLLLGWSFKLFSALLAFLNPLIQGWLIKHMESQLTDTPEPFWKGFFYCGLFAINFFVSTICTNVTYYADDKVKLRIRSSLIAAIYKKALTMSGDARQESTTGEIVNLMSVDALRTTAFANDAWVFFTRPVQVGVALYMLYQLLGNSMFAGIVLMVLIVPFSFAIGWFQRKIRINAMVIKDERIKMINEALSSIKVIKLYAWESSFEQKISELRDKEVKMQRKVNILTACQGMLYDMMPIFVMLVTFAIYTNTLPDHTLKASVAFVAISLFDLVKNPLTSLPHSISLFVMYSVSLSRIVKFFQGEDLDETNITVERTAEHAVEISDGTFSHVRSKPAVLHSVSMQIKQGSLSAIVGSVGAGKSSLLSSLVGDMYKHSGIVTLKGPVALVAQQAFILNATVKNNILFGAAYDESRYNTVIEACSLLKDMEVLPKGDNSMIGEKGINLSGGQKQRISLARAVYNDADIYLLDDPLSAVDAHVGKHIFDHVIGPNGLLKDKTRLMVTHGVHWLPHTDEIFVINHGRLSEHGTYNSLLTHNGDFAKFLKTYFLNGENGATNSADEENSEDEEEGEEFKQKILQRLESLTQNEQASDTENPKTSTQSSQDVDDEEEDVFDEQEEVETGKVLWTVYLTYFRAMGIMNVVICVLLILISGGLGLASSIWLSVWTGDEIFINSTVTNSEKQSTMEMYLGVLSGIGVVEVIVSLLMLLAGAYAFCRASANLHKLLLHSLLKAKPSFFDIKPLGMILNRFSKDMDVVDNDLGDSMVYLAWVLTTLITCVGGIIYATPLAVIAIVPITALYMYIQRFYISTSRQLRRLFSKARSPIISHFSETLAGTQTIRAYNHQERFIQDNVDKIEKYNIYQFFNDFADNWVNMRIAATGAVLVLVTVLLCMISTQIPFLHGHITPSIVGLALSLVFSLREMLNGMVWVLSDVETNIVSVERIKEYAEVEKEADWDSNWEPARGWPSSGFLQFDNYSMRYRPELDLVIKDFSLEIKSQEKIGIVGRTGAGKSSLTLSLFRMLESAGGSIKIDNVDISLLGLHQLRNSITILPQDPVVFSGSIRENLDPLTQSTDDRLWQVLAQCQLVEFVKEQPGQLSAECGESGKNLSVGQRQLICLARALLRKTKILIMDEATAAVDLKTDDFIQQTIRKEFADCTILTIAHRLNTIIDSDRILVMSQGRIAEFDTPHNLLANKQGVFYDMAKDAGLVQ